MTTLRTVPALSPAGRTARYALLALALGIILLLGLTTPARYALLATPCDGPAQACPGDRQLLAADIPGLQALGLSLPQYAALQVGLELAAAAGFLGVAGLLLLRRPRDWYAGLVCLVLILLAAESTLVMIGHQFPAFWWPISLLEFAGNAVLLPVLYLFPDGRFAPRWAGPLAFLAALPTGGRILFPGTPLDPTAWPPWLGLPTYVAVLATPALVQIIRFRTAGDPLQRQQIKWLAIGAAGMFACVLGMASGIVLHGSINPALAQLLYSLFRTVLMLPIPLALAVAVMRYRLWDLDLIIQRALLYGGLSLGLLLMNIAVVTWLSAALGISGGLLVSLVTTTLVALGFQPVYAYLQRRVTRLMFGDRGDPLAVMAQLTQLLEAPRAPQELLPNLVETTARVLRLPYVAVALDGQLAAASGSPGPELVELPLLHQGRALGALQVALRAPGEPLGPDDMQLLTHIAGQAAVAALAMRLNEDVQRSRQQIVSAREEERRRLRRDLHDGLGPVLASLTLSLDAALNMLPREAASVRDLLTDLRDEARTATTDIRRLVHGLRPPSLDLGIRAALTDLIGTYQHVEGLTISLDVPDALPPLPAAVEVAVYRIVQEALTNTARHARASSARVSLAVSPGAAELAVRDNGCGIAPGRPSGVGMQSMRERAAELGGTCVVAPGAEGGTCVTVILPLPGGGPDGVR